MKSKDGPAKPSRFEVVIPLPKYIADFVPNNIIENLLNLPCSGSNQMLLLVQNLSDGCRNNLSLRRRQLETNL